jgi:hypothetical protein
VISCIPEVDSFASIFNLYLPSVYGMKPLQLCKSFLVLFNTLSLVDITVLQVKKTALPNDPPNDFDMSQVSAAALNSAKEILLLLSPFPYLGFLR